MKKISDFLGKFKNLEHPDKKKDMLVKFLFIETGILLDKNDLDVRGKTLFVRADGYAKSELYIKKESLLKKLSENFSDFRINDIR